jgi:hypothetical protein
MVLLALELGCLSKNHRQRPNVVCCLLKLSLIVLSSGGLMAFVVYTETKASLCVWEFLSNTVLHGNKKSIKAYRGLMSMYEMLGLVLICTMALG